MLVCAVRAPVCVRACARARVCVCVRALACACVYALRIVSTDNILRFISTLIIIVSYLGKEARG